MVGLRTAGTAGILTGMTVFAKVQNGVIALPPGTRLPEGAEVQILVPDDAPMPADGRGFHGGTAGGRCVGLDARIRGHR